MIFLHNLKEDILSFFRLQFIWLLPLMTSLVFEGFFLFLYNKNLLNVTAILNLSLLEFNFTMAGFLLATIGILISARDKKFIQILIIAGRWQPVEKSAFLGILCHFISAFVSVINILITPVYLVSRNIELLLSILGISYSVLVVYWLYQAYKNM